MARIAIFTYDHTIDRRALLQCKSLIAHGHEVELFALQAETPTQDPAFVTRISTSPADPQSFMPSDADSASEITDESMDANAPMLMGGQAPKPFSYRLYHALKQRFPILFPIVKPIGRPLFWLVYGILHPNQTPWTLRIRGMLHLKFPRLFNATPIAYRVKDILNHYCPRTFNLMKPFLRRVYWWLNKRNPASYFIALYAPVLQHIRPADIVIAHDLPMLPVTVSAMQYTGGVLVYDSHELFCEQEYNEFEKQMWKRLEIEHIGKARKVITVNPTIARELEKRYSIPHVDVIMNAEWIDAGEPQKGRVFHALFNLPEEAQVVLYQGGLSYGRNLDVLVKSMRYVTNSNVHMVILGSGPAGKELEAIVAQYKMEDRVHFHPHVPQAELLAHTASADVGVIPYTDTCLNNRYCTPNKMFEFIAAGLPMIGTELPEITRMCNEFGIGMVGDTTQPQTLAALIEKALVPATLKRSREQVAKARQIVNWQNEGEKFVAIVESALHA